MYPRKICKCVFIFCAVESKSVLKKLEEEKELLKEELWRWLKTVITFYNPKGNNWIWTGLKTISYYFENFPVSKNLFQEICFKNFHRKNFIKFKYHFAKSQWRVFLYHFMCIFYPIIHISLSHPAVNASYTVKRTMFSLKPYHL